jgi:HAD superfamily hydrolase (TIGR01549 family)
MIDTILFDLDGTLLPFSQKDFTDNYYKKLLVKGIELGYDKERFLPAIFSGVKSMAKNDGNRSNAEAFWSAFAGATKTDVDEIVARLEHFYENEFDTVKEIMQPTPTPRSIILKLKEKGYDLILATSPMFPPVAARTRLSWIELKPEDFDYYTTYENSTYCKPNPEYFREILTKTDKNPAQCLMVGNNVAEDMCAKKLGMEVYLITDYIENEAGEDYSAYRQGSLADFEAYVDTLPDLK